MRRERERSLPRVDQSPLAARRRERSLYHRITTSGIGTMVANMKALDQHSEYLDHLLAVLELYSNENQAEFEMTTWKCK